MLRFLIEKEFKQIRRNVFMPKLIVALPTIMMFVLPWAANQEVRDVSLAIVDNDHSTFSRRLTEKLASSGYFRLADVAATYPEAMESVETGAADIILEIAPGFERDMVGGEPGRVMISANAVNGTKGALGGSYLQAIIAEYSDELRGETGAAAAPSFEVMPQYRFNPLLDYKVFMVPGLIVMLLTMLCGFLPALNIVSEKEVGTIEQINVTPVRKIDFVLGKLIPYWLIGFLTMGLCMLLGWLVYGVHPEGSVGVILLFAVVYILVVSGMGLIISNYSDTMQQAMFVAFFFIMILFLISGLFTPVASMPGWAQVIAAVNPLKYFVEVMRMVYLKGSGFCQLLPQFFALCGFAAAFNVWAVASYRKNN